MRTVAAKPTAPVGPLGALRPTATACTPSATVPALLSSLPAKAVLPAAGAKALGQVSQPTVVVPLVTPVAAQGGHRPLRPRVGVAAPVVAEEVDAATDLMTPVASVHEAVGVGQKEVAGVK